MKTIPALAAWACAASCSVTLAAPPPTLSFDDVRSGMRGEGRTVFEGNRIETFQVEIVGKLPRIGPDQNLILARLTGGPLAQTGVLAGMSGSPVWVDGKLVGAVAYSWGFSKEALAGITPIAEMFAVSRREVAPRARAAALERGALDLAREPARLATFFERDLPRRLPVLSLPAVRAVPIAVAGMAPEGFSRVAPGLAAAGFLPVQSGSAGAGSGPPPKLEPGSPVGVQLVRGDVDITATGTVTWVDGDQVYAFGHPLYGLGSVDLPLTAARVETLLASLNASSKIAVPLDEIGAFRQDRTAAIWGRLGVKPRMIPVRLQWSDASGGRRAYAFDVASDPLLGPLLLYNVLNGIVGGNERIYGTTTLRLREGSVIKIDGEDDVELDNLFAGDSAPGYATGLSAYILYLLMNNDWRTPSISGVNLILDYEDGPRTAVIRRVTLDRHRVHAGEKVHAAIVLSPYRGPDQVLEREIEIPEETPAGRLLVQVGDAGSVSRAESADDPVGPRDLGQLVRLINRLRRNDRVYVVGSRQDAGVSLGGARLPNLPPSALGILTRPRSTGNYALLPLRVVLEEEIRTDYAVEGFARVQLEVEER
ncbi:MAG TPA: SpoIVB peptidase S55 domain-containing protein [Candidatus Polarisedimenticolaceae bacterium]